MNKLALDKEGGRLTALNDEQWEQQQQLHDASVKLIKAIETELAELKAENKDLRKAHLMG
mgnify:CR=1 FL=1